MKIEHIAIWSNDIERLKEFYVKYFDAKSNTKYVNEMKKFKSYFLSFDAGARLEIMQMPDLVYNEDTSVNFVGFSHFAVSVGSKENVVFMTNTIRTDGHKIISEPRYTGDGYFESVVEDPDGNCVEITI